MATDEKLLAMARNVRAGLQHAVDYDDEVATIYNALRWAQREKPADQPAPTETYVFADPSAPNCPECYFPLTAHHPSCPRLAHALANPPGPRHARLVEQTPAYTTADEIAGLEPQGAPRFQGETCSRSLPKAGAEYGHLYTRGRCEWCNITHPNCSEVVK